MSDVVLLDRPSPELFCRVDSMSSADRLIVMLGESVEPAMLAGLEGVFVFQNASWGGAAEQIARSWKPLSARFDFGPDNRETWSRGEAGAAALGNVGIFVSNDTHVNTFAPLYSRHPQCVFIPDPTLNENSISQLDRMGLPYIPYDRASMDDLEVDVGLLANDWGPFSYAIDRLRESGIPTFCVQEGCLDFNEQGFPYRMRMADYVGIQGLATIRHLRRRTQFVTGNPRFEDLKTKPLPKDHCAMINSNFTYGIFEEWRDAWLASAMEACKSLGIPFFISRHPRERIGRSTQRMVGSGPDSVHDQIREASLLITRFSSLVYEALMMGRDVIYYNPHGETMGLFNQDQTGGIIQARSRDGLVSALKRVTRHQVGDAIPAEKRALFLGMHVGSDPGHASDRLIEALRIVQACGVPEAHADYLPPRNPVSLSQRAHRAPIKAKRLAGSYARLIAFLARRYLDQGRYSSRTN